MFKWFIKTIKYLWELPQNLIGFVFSLNCIKEQYNVDGETVDVYFKKGFYGGISLGKYIILGSQYKTYPNCILEPTIRHEHGHQIQSHISGPFYLLVFGLPSLFRNIMCRSFNRRLSYYNGYPENMADEFGGVNRKLAQLQWIEYFKSLNKDLQKSQNLLYYRYNKRG